MEGKKWHVEPLFCCLSASQVTSVRSFNLAAHCSTFLFNASLAVALCDHTEAWQVEMLQYAQLVCPESALRTFKILSKFQTVCHCYSASEPDKRTLLTAAAAAVDSAEANTESLLLFVLPLDKLGTCCCATSSACSSVTLEQSRGF